jgi:hypothetical protein
MSLDEKLAQLKAEIEAEPNSYVRMFGWHLYWSAFLANRPQPSQELEKK